MAQPNAGGCPITAMSLLVALCISTTCCEADTGSELGLALQIGVTRYRESRQFYQGEPIWVGVNIARNKTVGETDVKPLRIGTEQLAWHDNISFRISKTEHLPAGSSPPTARQPMKVPLAEVRVEKWVFQAQSKAEEELSPSQLFRSSWIIGPAVTSEWPVGEYVIEAVFDTNDKRETHPTIFHGKLQSNEVTITIAEPRNDEAKAEVLVSQARYCMNQEKDFDEAIRRLNEATRLNPASKDIHCQLGMAYERKGDFRTAIREYRAYVEGVRSSNRQTTGEDNASLHADRIEDLIKVLEKRVAERQ